jgi:hypothetical protein
MDPTCILGNGRLARCDRQNAEIMETARAHHNSEKFAATLRQVEAQPAQDSPRPQMARQGAANSL